MDIKQLLELCVNSKASDLHISPGCKPLLRIDGELVTLDEQPVLTKEITHQYIFDVLTIDQQKAYDKLLELDFALSLPKVASFRGNAFQQINGLAAAFRVIPHDIPSFEDISAPEVLKKVLQLSSGLILLTGPAGSGKSTTLAAMVDYINTNMANHIITLEDPIEFVHVNKKSLINQRQIYRDTHSFSSSLRAALREDPDVILVGEMRDLETIRLALVAAETGHLVLATLHTSSAPQAVNRIIDVFPPGEKHIIRNIVSQSLQAVIYQTLLKKKGGGRVGAYEILLGIPSVRNLIRKDQISQIYTVMQTSRDKGMVMMDKAIDELIEKGIIDMDAEEQSGFKRQLFEDRDMRETHKDKNNDNGGRDE